MPDLPAMVRIGAVDYTVELVDELANSEGAALGELNTGKSRIRIEADSDPQIQYITLWHEIFHGLFFNAGKSFHDEELMDLLAYGIVQVLRDNEGLRNG